VQEHPLVSAQALRDASRLVHDLGGQRAPLREIGSAESTSIEVSERRNISSRKLSIE
jgi:hypothetical protein